MLILRATPHIFKLKTKTGKIKPFEPNLVQRSVLREIRQQIKEKGKARIIVIKGRQQGVTTLTQLVELSYVLTTPAFNAYTMAHDVSIANEIFSEKIKFAFDNLPPELVGSGLIQARRNNIRQLEFEGDLNGSKITVGLSARGTTQNFLHISEAGKMSENAILWKEMIEGSLPAAEHAEVIIIESTADGGHGAFYEFVQASLKGENEFKTMFLRWTDSEEYQTEPPDNDDWIEKYKTKAIRYRIPTDPMTSHGLNKKQWYWYYNRLNEQGGAVKVQYPLDLDQAFDKDVEGAYYQNEIDDMNQEGRFGSHIQHDPKQLVNTHWDLARGKGADKIACWFWQMNGDKIRIIDYYEAEGQPALKTAQDLFSKPYIYGTHYAPHDAAQTQLGLDSNLTQTQIYKEAGINMSQQARGTINDGIEAVRFMFPYIEMAQNEGTTLGMNRLRSYHKKVDKGGNWVEDHDINSHAADAFRGLCSTVRLNQYNQKRQEVFNANRYHEAKEIEDTPFIWK